jgi:DNA-binding IclR family transcriptional regulator
MSGQISDPLIRLGAAQMRQLLDRTSQRAVAVLSRRYQCASWKEFRDHLIKIRKAGVAVTNSEVARGRVGIAAPIFASKQVIGGLSLVVNEADFEDERQREAVIASAQAITDALAKEEPWIARS